MALQQEQQYGLQLSAIQHQQLYLNTLDGGLKSIERISKSLLRRDDPEDAEFFCSNMLGQLEATDTLLRFLMRENKCDDTTTNAAKTSIGKFVRQMVFKFNSMESSKEKDHAKSIFCHAVAYLLKGFENEMVQRLPVFSCNGASDGQKNEAMSRFLGALHVISDNMEEVQKNSLRILQQRRDEGKLANTFSEELEVFAAIQVNTEVLTSPIVSKTRRPMTIEEATMAMKRAFREQQYIDSVLQDIPVNDDGVPELDGCGCSRVATHNKSVDDVMQEEHVLENVNKMVEGRASANTKDTDEKETDNLIYEVAGKAWKRFCRHFTRDDRCERNYQERSVGDEKLVPDLEEAIKTKCEEYASEVNTSFLVGDICRAESDGMIGTIFSMDPRKGIELKLEAEPSRLVSPQQLTLLTRSGFLMFPWNTFDVNEDDEKSCEVNKQKECQNISATMLEVAGVNGEAPIKGELENKEGLQFQAHLAFDLQQWHRVSNKFYINSTRNITGVANQMKRPNCYAHAATSAYINASFRIFGAESAKPKMTDKVYADMMDTADANTCGGLIENAINALDRMMHRGISAKVVRNKNLDSYQVLTSVVVLAFFTTNQGWAMCRKGDFTQRPLDFDAVHWNDKTGGDWTNPTLKTKYHLGGHAVLVEGYDFQTQCYRCKNSWGAWGDNGRFWFKPDAAHSHYWVVVAPDKNVKGAIEFPKPEFQHGPEFDGAWIYVNKHVRDFDNQYFCKTLKNPVSGFGFVARDVHEYLSEFETLANLDPSTPEARRLEESLLIGDERVVDDIPEGNTLRAVLLSAKSHAATCTSCDGVYQQSSLMLNEKEIWVNVEKEIWIGWSVACNAWFICPRSKLVDALDNPKHLQNGFSMSINGESELENTCWKEYQVMIDTEEQTNKVPKDKESIEVPVIVEDRRKNIDEDEGKNDESDVSGSTHIRAKIVEEVVDTCAQDIAGINKSNEDVETLRAQIKDLDASRTNVDFDSDFSAYFLPFQSAFTRKNADVPILRNLRIPDPTKRTSIPVGYDSDDVSKQSKEKPSNYFVQTPVEISLHNLDEYPSTVNIQDCARLVIEEINSAYDLGKVSSKNRLVICLHGYNNSGYVTERLVSFDDVLGTRDVAVVSWNWFSCGQKLMHPDRHAETVAPRFREFLLAIRSEGSRDLKVSIIAHSLGNLVMVLAMEMAMFAFQDCKIISVVPAVMRGRFLDAVNTSGEKVDSWTLYYNPNDSALWCSAGKHWVESDYAYSIEVPVHYNDFPGDKSLRYIHTVQAVREDVKAVILGESADPNGRRLRKKDDCISRGWVLDILQ